MMTRNLGPTLPGFVASLFLATGCAHSEQEWQAQVRANEQLRARLETTQSQATALQAAATQSSTKLEQLQRELQVAGVDPNDLHKGLEQQARASEH